MRLNRALLIILLVVLVIGNCLVFGTLCALLNHYLPPLPTSTATYTPIKITPRPTYTPLPTRVGLPTYTPLYSPTPTPTAPTATLAPSPTPTLYFGPPSPTNTVPPTATSRPTVTATATHTPTSSPSRTPTRTPAATPTATHTPTHTPTSSPTRTPTRTPAVTPTATRTPLPTPTPTRTPIPRPAPVTDLRAQALGPASIRLTWSASRTTEVVGYWVYGDDGSVGTRFRRLAWVTGTTFTDEGLPAGFLYIYYVRAAVGAAESRASNLAGVITPPQPTATASPTPTLVLATPIPTHSPPVTSSRPSVTPSVTQPSPGRTPPPSITPEPGRRLMLSVVSHRRYVDEFGELRIVGEVRNDFDVNAQAVVITALLYDAQGRELERVTVPTLLKLVRAGQRVPFLIVRPAPKGLHSYTLLAAGVSTTQLSAASLAVVEKKQYEDQAGLYHVEGRVSNVGATVVDYVRVALTIYDADGDVVNAEAAYTTPQRLAPGESGAFHLTVLQAPQALRYVVQVEGEPL